MAYGTLIHKGSPIIPILSRIYAIPHIDTYFFKIHSNIVYIIYYIIYIYLPEQDVQDIRKEDGVT